MTLWLYLHFPELQLSTIYKQLDGQDTPLIIVDESTNEVVQLNSMARTEGIQVGMGLGTAASLCRYLQVKPYDENIEKRILKRIAHWLYAVSADLTLFPPNGLLLRVSNMLNLYQGLTHYWQVLSQHLNRLGIDYTYATGYSPFAARLLAKQQLNQISEDKDWLLNQIKQQALKHADLTPQTITRLQKVGVSTFADVLSIPMPALAKRFTIDVVSYIGRLIGHIQHYVNFYIPPAHFEQYLELYFEVSNHQYLEKPLLKLYQLLESYLTLKDKLATELTVKLHQRDEGDVILPIIAAQGEYRADKWLQLTQLKLESTTLTAPVTGITLNADRLSGKYAQRNDLFSGSQGSLSAQELTAILSAKLGRDKVNSITIQADDRPEIANQLCEPFSAQPSDVVKPDHAVQQKLRPSLLLAAPLPLQEQVTVMSPPERIVTGWWDNNPINRDYFIARSDNGRWLWLFRDQHQHWFVHGVFS